MVITGLSGSGKSSLAFDTIYAEGQRRYMESLNSYARQFLGTMDKPDVDSIEGLSPAISIDQKSTSRNPRSTVATVTEIYDYLRLLFARIGVPHCPICGNEVTRRTTEVIIDEILRQFVDKRICYWRQLLRIKKVSLRIFQSNISDLVMPGFVWTAWCTRWMNFQSCKKVTNITSSWWLIGWR